MAEEIPAGKTTRALSSIARKKKINIVAGIVESAKVKIYIIPLFWFRLKDIWQLTEKFIFLTKKICGLNRVMRVLMSLIWDLQDWNNDLLRLVFPESARILALKGADIICHPANLVLPYCQDAMVTRCLENKIYTITANRTGCEERSGKKFSYTGKSQITSPDARILYRADAQNDEIGIVEIDVQIARNKRINKHNNIFADRRPEYYQDLVKTDF